MCLLWRWIYVFDAFVDVFVVAMDPYVFDLFVVSTCCFYPLFIFKSTPTSNGRVWVENNYPSKKWGG
jgi:hypothetical protein